jgi:hypothetical protein
MPRPSVAPVGIVLVGVLATAACPIDAARAESPCMAKKIQLMAKRLAAELKCRAAAVERGRPPDATCLAKARDRFRDKFQLVEVAQSCSGALGRCDFQVADCLDVVAAALPDAGPSKCEASKLKAAGKRAASNLRCYGKAARRGVGADPRCFEKNEERFAAAVAKAELTGPCPGAAASLGALLDDECGNDLVTAPASLVTGLCEGLIDRCCDRSTLRLTTAAGMGTCGAAAGGAALNLACGGLYLGSSGGLSVPLPATVPEGATALFDVGSCSPVTGGFSLTGRSQAATGSDRTCTTTGCRFGAPIPFGNDEVISWCIIPELAADASGSGNCVDGRIALDLPLRWDVYLTGDVAPFLAGVQPCPVCIAGPCGSGRCCQGGPNDGMDCTPDGFGGGTAFPTSHDCLPPPSALLSLAVDMPLTTDGMATFGLPSATQASVFCGYCRNADGFGQFGLCSDGTTPCGLDADCGGGTCGDLVPCSSDADCSQPREACEQYGPGAFYDAATTAIGAAGAAAGRLTDGNAHPATLASVFCVPPSTKSVAFNAFFSGVPGPGAVSIPADVELQP